ncbi:MAG: apolipoprotein N-acyltransferase [Phycisphaerales bacterium]|nr:apolipoprotein N-acyltransferase [Phycisphaerales bacterium]
MSREANQPTEEPKTTEPLARDDASPRVHWWHALLVGLAHAGLMLLAFPPVWLWGVAFVAVLPLAWIAWKTPRPFRHALCVLVGVLPFYAVEFWYVADISMAGLPPLLLYLAAWPAAFVWLAGAIRRRFPKLPAILLIPIVWVGLDALRGEVLFGGFEWYTLGQPLIASRIFAAPATVGGVYLVTLMTVLLAGIAIDMRTDESGRKKRAAVLLVGLLIFWGASSFLVGDFRPQKLVNAAVVQTNVPQDNKIGWTAEMRQRDFAEFARLTRVAAAQSPDLIVWPETMFPGFALDDEGARYLDEVGLSGFNAMRDELLALQREIGVPMLVGATTAENLRVVDNGDRFWFESDGTYNSVYLIENGRVQPDRYDKIAPTPFGETLPYINDWPWLKDLVLQIGLGASGMDFGLEAGKAPRTISLEIDGQRIQMATPVCFESTQSRIVRRIVESSDGTNLMVLMTNDGWFGLADRGREMHLALARWRCLELGLPMVRSANTGISASIDHRGRVLGRVEPDTSGVLMVPVQAGRAWTLYGVIGNAVGWMALAGTGVLVGLWLMAARKDRHGRKLGTNG